MPNQGKSWEMLILWILGLEHNLSSYLFTLVQTLALQGHAQTCPLMHLPNLNYKSTSLHGSLQPHSQFDENHALKDLYGSSLQQFKTPHQESSYMFSRNQTVPSRKALFYNSL